MKKIGLSLLFIAAFAMPAHAITTAQRIARLKYALCMSNPLVPDKTLCHL